MEQNERSCSARCHPGLLAQGLACGGGKLSILVLLRLGKGGLQGDLPEVLGQVAGKRQCSARTRKQQTNPAGVWSSEQAEGVALPITRYLTASQYQPFSFRNSLLRGAAACTRGCRIKKLRDGFQVGMGSRARSVGDTRSVAGSAGAAGSCGEHHQVLVFCPLLSRVGFSQ